MSGTCSLNLSSGNHYNNLCNVCVSYRCLIVWQFERPISCWSYCPNVWQVYIRNVYSCICSIKCFYRNKITVSRGSAYFGAASKTNPIWLDDVHCSGNENNILNCQHKAFGLTNCQHTEDVGIDCDAGKSTNNILKMLILTVMLIRELTVNILRMLVLTVMLVS